MLSTFLEESNVNDKLKRTLNQFLQSSEVSVVLGAGLLNCNDKELVVDVLLLMNECLSNSGSKRFNAFGLAEGIISFGQRWTESNDHMESELAGLEANVESSTKTIDKLQAEMQKMLHVHDELRLQHDQELKELGAKFAEQVRQKDEVMLKNYEVYETKIRELTAQCENLAQHINKKASAIQQRDQLLQENRMKRCVLEDENAEFKRKVQVLEIRIEEIAQSHSVASEEMKHREREFAALREEMATVSSDYATKREELEHVLDENKVMCRGERILKMSSRDIGLPLMWVVTIHAGFRRAAQGATVCRGKHVQRAGTAVEGTQGHCRRETCFGARDGDDTRRAGKRRVVERVVAVAVAGEEGHGDPAGEKGGHELVKQPMQLSD